MKSIPLAAFQVSIFTVDYGDFKEQSMQIMTSESILYIWVHAEVYTYV